MQHKRGELVPIGDAVSGLGSPVKAIRAVSPQARHHFTRFDQVNQIVSASEANPERGFMARMMALCSSPRTNPGNQKAVCHRCPARSGPRPLPAMPSRLHPCGVPAAGRSRVDRLQESWHRESDGDERRRGRRPAGFCQEQTLVLLAAIWPHNDLDSTIAISRKQAVFHLFLDAALKTVAYLCISTRSQDLANQKLAILGFSQKRGFTVDQFIESRISSRKRPLHGNVSAMSGWAASTRTQNVVTSSGQKTVTLADGR